MTWRVIMKRGNKPDLVREHDTEAGALRRALVLADLHGLPASAVVQDNAKQEMRLDASDWYLPD